MHPKDVAKTAVITPFGLHKWSKMPIGLLNAGCIFHRVINEVLRDLPFMYVYIDDILVSSWTIEEHEDHLREVFTRLCANNVTVNMEKCMLAQPP